MRRIVIWLAATVTIVVLLFGYHTSTNRTESATASAAAPSAAAPSAAAPSAAAPSAAAPSAPAPSSSSAERQTKNYTGSLAQTEWGPVQVEITVENGQVTAVDVVASPDGNHRDIEINGRALPVLVQETIDAQSAQIDMVSGATVTSDGYVRSLQAALDDAGI